MTNDPITSTAAWSHIDGMNQLIGAKQRLDALPPVDVPGGYTHIIDDAMDALLGGDDPTPILATLADAERAAEAARRVGTARQQLAAQLRDRITTARALGADQALAWLAERLAETMTRLQPHRDLIVETTSGDDAIRRGGKYVTAWRAFTEACESYEQIRATQLAVTGAARGTGSGTPTAELVGDYGIVAGRGPQVVPDDPLTGGAGRIRTVCDWPTDPAEQLRWSLETGAALWVPSIDELEGAQQAEMQRRTQDAGQHRQPQRMSEREFEHRLTIENANKFDPEFE